MAETLTRADVERIATLARLELTPDEVTLFAGQLTAILAYADQVQQVDTSGLPTVALAEVGVDVGFVMVGAATPVKAATREDVPAPSLDRDVLLSQAGAADRTAGLFKVPRVLGS